MKVVINIPKDVYKTIKESQRIYVYGMRGGKRLLAILMNAVRNGKAIREERIENNEPEYNETIFRDTYGNAVSCMRIPIKSWIYKGEWQNTFGALVECPYCGAGSITGSSDYCWHCNMRVKRLTCGGCSKYLTEDCHAERLTMDYSNICEDFEGKEDET